MSLINPLSLADFGRCARAPAWVGVLALFGCGSVAAQTEPSPTPAAQTQSESVSPQAVAPPVLVASGPRWSELSLSQQDALMPLYGTWTSLDAIRKRKWMAVAQNFPGLSPSEQSKLHSRMAEWAALSPSERDLARFNFFATKKIAGSERASTWEAYKALSPEERQRLGANASVKPAGTATAIKPAHTEKLTEVPITRRTPVSVRDLVFSKQSIDRNTLLPLAIKPAVESPAR